MKVLNTFKNSKRMVIKIGSSLLTNRKGNVNKNVLRNVVNDISALLKKNKEIILVSSGAISLGKGKLKLNKKLSLHESQAVAATGQIELMFSWQKEFNKHNIFVAQLLLSPSDATNKKSSINAIATIENLLDFKCMPIINENDTTATDEIKFGDNDILAAQIARLVKADHLILLSNVDGLYKEPPVNDKEGILISEVKSITNTIHAMAGTASRLGKGGMISKIKAAEICLKSNCSVIITSGQKQKPIMGLSKISTKATRFIAKK